MERGEQILPTPELEELQQLDQPAITVPVRHEGPVTAHILPSRKVQHSTDSAPLGEAFVQIAPGTQKRARGCLISMDSDVIINDRSTGGGMIWPKLVPFVFTHTRPVFVKGATADTRIGLTLELWAD